MAGRPLPPLPSPGTPVCALADLPDKTARGFEFETPDGPSGLIVWRDGDALRGFLNHCPHLGLPLETFPDRFLSADGRHLICSAHGARFDFEGACFAGPCRGRALAGVALTLEDGQIRVAG